MGVDENKAAILRPLERLNAGDVDGCVELYAPDARLYGYTPEPLDRDGIRGFYTMVGSAFSDSRVTVEDVFGEGDEIAVRVTFTGRHEGEFMGVPATGKEVSMSGATSSASQEGAASSAGRAPTSSAS